jgi:hypothetical protein
MIGFYPIFSLFLNIARRAWARLRCLADRRECSIGILLLEADGGLTPTTRADAWLAEGSRLACFR